MAEQPNRLINEKSPYLLQHALNPVDWFPWGEEALAKAIQEDKPIIVSIGYSACHWCHVMEHESFEDPEVAEIMNTFFVNIKVDREERPDVDHVYMDAVQVMGIQGGWPLNVFLTPDQKPFYGGTYFPKKAWIEILDNIRTAYRDKKEKLQESADKLTMALQESAIKTYSLHESGSPVEVEMLRNAFDKLQEDFDTEMGGSSGAPKFPMPAIWQFCLKYHHLTADEFALAQVNTTLQEMAYGGIYDQLGGGFARYSVDDEWFAPHFEKMLYDNAQLLSLYAEAYQLTKNELYKKVVFETIGFLSRELSAEEGGFYSALDADSEGEEGRFYTWTKAEIDELLGPNSPIICEYYNITEKGNWEDGRNILYQDKDPDMVAKITNRSEAETLHLIKELNTFLLEERNKKVRPGLDDKILAGWNGLALSGLAKAYQVFGEEKFLDLANSNAAFIKNKLMVNGKLYRTYKGGEASITAYLEDYAAVIGGMIQLYQANFDKQWLQFAEELTEAAMQQFFDAEEGFFHFSPNDAEPLIARKKELFDNVIPSSNAMMAENLYLLGCLTANQAYADLAVDMLEKVMQLIQMNARYMSHWAGTAVLMAKPAAELAIVGPNFKESAQQLYAHYLPCKVVAAAAQADEQLNLLMNREAINGKDSFYVCHNHVCQQPVSSLEEAVELLR